MRDPNSFLQDLGFNLFQGWVSGFWRKRKAGSRKWKTNWVPDLVMLWCWLQDILFIHVGRNLVSKVNWGFSNVRKNSWRQLTRYINYYNLLSTLSWPCHIQNCYYFPIWLSAMGLLDEGIWIFCTKALLQSSQVKCTPPPPPKNLLRNLLFESWIRFLL